MLRGASDGGRPLHPSASTETESRLEARHIQFSFEPNLRIDQIRDVEGNQVRRSSTARRRTWSRGTPSR